MVKILSNNQVINVVTIRDLVLRIYGDNKVKVVRKIVKFNK